MAASTPMTADLADADESLHQAYQDLQKTDTTDRGAKLQVFCENVWDRLEHAPPLAEAVVNGFVAMLKSNEDHLLASLVIPDLRPRAPDPTNPLKRSIVHHIHSGTPRLEYLNQRRQIRDPVDRRLYEEEHKVLQEQELYRASILLYSRGNISEAQKEALRQWLATYPRADARAADDNC